MTHKLNRLALRVLPWVMLPVFVGALRGLAHAAPPQAPAPQPTAFQTPTPGADGRIVYIIQSGDTLWRISAVSGVPLDQLERLNNITRDATLSVGRELVLGFGEAATALPTLAFAATPSPTPFTVTGTGDICVEFFNDINGDASRQESEGLVPGGQIVVAQADGAQVGSYTTDGTSEPYCFAQFSSGDYNIAAAAPEGYNPTSSMNTPLRLEPGAKAYVAFAVQVSQRQSDTASSSRSSSLGIVGLVLLAAAGGLAYYLSRQARQRG
jgi:hypothetical protein